MPEVAAPDGATEHGSIEGLTAARRSFALKHGDTFLVADTFGDVYGDGDGLFRDDTRVLSSFRLLLAERRPSLLSGAVSQDNVFFTANLTNHPLPPLGGQSTPEGVIHIERLRLLWDATLHECVTLTNFGDFEAHLPLKVRFAADFRDMFEVRGKQRAARGRVLEPELHERHVCLSYEGLDGVVRATVVRFSEAPVRLQESSAEFAVTLAPHASREIYIEVSPNTGAVPGRKQFRAAAARARWGMRGVRRRGAALRSSGRLFNDWLERSRADLALLTTSLPTGPFPYAGIPWFSTPFGRDAVITSLQTLWLDPSLAKGVLGYLAQHQAREKSAFREAAPGKIMHETRKGEMTALHELPFGEYYGGVDTTPLFVMLAGAYARRTGDLAFIDQLWPSLNAAMVWVEGDGDSDGDGFVDYVGDKGKGLTNQGWKDSADSIFHRDGRLAEGPIAVVEVQGYAFAAFKAMARLAGLRHESEKADHWRRRATELRAAVEACFWMADLDFYAIARDGEHRQCRVRASNPGHLLYVGLPSVARAGRVIDRLMSPSFNSGWGIRTLAGGEPRFNPMSYHNGSVWPHDTALCAAGLARYGNRTGVVRLLNEAFEAAVGFDMRLPELFCGFARAPGEPPVAYPVACLPQAWSSGAPFMLLQGCLGLRIDGVRREIHIERPALPVGIDSLAVRGLAIGDQRIDLAFQRQGKRVVASASGGSSISVRIDN